MSSSRSGASSKPRAAKPRTAKPVPLASLAVWPASKSLQDVFEKNFSAAEMLMSHRTACGIAPGPEVPDFELRQSLVFMAKGTDEVQTSLFHFQDEAESSAVMVRILNVRAQPGGAPLFEVEYVHAKRERVEQTLHLIQYLVRASPAGTSQLKASVAEQKLLLAELERNARSGKYVLGKPSKPGMTRSYLVEIKPEEEKVGAVQKRERICAICEAPATKRCSGCKSSHYCSADHQREHWVGGHKRLCLNRESARENGFDAETQSVVFAVLSPDPSMRTFATNISMIRGKTSPILNMSKCPVNLHGDSEFVIKAQLPLTNGTDVCPVDIMLYDEKRSFQRIVNPSEAVHNALASGIRAHPQYFGGIKLFFWAKREADNFRVFLGKLPDQNQGW